MTFSKRKGLFLLSFALLGLTSCAAKFRFEAYVFPELETTPFSQIDGENYYRLGYYRSIRTTKGMIPARLGDLYAVGNQRYVVPSLGTPYLTVIPVDFSDYPYEKCGANAIEQIREAFFGDTAFNQFYSLAEYYDKTSFHRLQVQGEVAPKPFRSEETYAVLKTKNNASQTKAALLKIHEDAVAWYNEQDYGRTLDEHDPIYFVYSAPYSGMEGGSSSRSSMMWAFTVNEPAPICWSSFYMAHPAEDGALDAHTFIHEFGHMLGLKDYYDQNSYSDLSACSPMGRMDMMDCSLGEHNPFSKMSLEWARPYIPKGECEITLRPSSGNGDCLLLPIGDYNGTPFDEYVLLEFYVPGYLNSADASLRPDPLMSLPKLSGVRAYHVDARLGLFNDRAKAPVSYLTEETEIGNNNIDLYCDNSGYVRQGHAMSQRGFLIQALEDGDSGLLIENFIAADHNEDLPVDNKVAHLRDVLFEKGEGIDEGFTNLNPHKTGADLTFGFEISELSLTYAKIRCFPLGE